MKKKILVALAAVMLTITPSFASKYKAYYKCDGRIFCCYIIADNYQEAVEIANSITNPCAD